MRIAFYAPLKPPGHPVASGDRAMARALIAALGRHHSVEIASKLRSFNSGNFSRQERIREIGQRLAERLCRKFEARPRAARPDLWFTYHLYHKAPDWLGPAVADRLDIPYVLAEASFSGKQAGGPWDLGHRAAAAAIRRADLVLQPNPADCPGIMQVPGVAKRPVTMRPFLDTAPWRAPQRAESRAETAGRLGLDPAQPWLLTVAMMRADQKLASYRCLADALQRIAGRDWTLIVAGAGAAEAEVRAAFAPLGARIRWIGVPEPQHLPVLARAADLFVWPALKEAWGMALLEAQAAGLPVVAGRSGGVAEIVADGETGLLTPEGDADAFAAAMASLLDDPQRRREMATAAEARAAREHDIGVAANRLDRLLRDLVER